MASVTFLSSVGGDNSTVTDDTNATTGLGNGGHRLRFVPALAQIVAIAVNAVNSATSASASASSATTQATNASTSATNANNSFLSLDKKYLGSKTGDPTLDNQGAALATGALYWNSSTTKHRVYNGASWVDVVASSGAFADNNFILNDNVDSTKKVNFEVSGVGSGTTVTLTIPNGSGTILTSAGGYAPLANPTFTGTVTLPTITSTGGTGLNLTNGTSNIILFNTAGSAQPSFNTRSVGTKVVLYPQIGATTTDYAFGVETAGFLWSSTQSTAQGFKWYGGITLAATLMGNGNFTLAGALNAPSTDIGSAAATRVSVETGSDSTNRWQTVANFFNSLGTILSRESNRGRFVNQLANASRLVAGNIYNFYAPTGVTTWTMPSIANSAMGDTIVLLSMDYLGSVGGWSSAFTLTIACDTGVYIGNGASGESFQLDDNRIKIFTLTCSYVDGSSANWAIG